MTDLENRLLAAGALIDGVGLDAWLALRPDEDQHLRALAIAGYPETITEAHAANAEARAEAARAEREAKKLADEEATAWTEHEAQSA